MSQNLITFDVTDQQVQAVRAALDAIEAALPGLISIEPEDRKGLVILGPKSEAFARQTLRVLEENPRIVPPSLDLAAAKADLDAHDRLRPLLERARRLVSRLDDTVTALGSDTMDVALEGYAQIKLSGGAHGLDELRRELSGRWARTRRKPATPEPA
ncbi:MAG TPA: hypothetical protein VIG68_04705 [Lysobacter sp.]